MIRKESVQRLSWLAERGNVRPRKILRKAFINLAVLVMGFIAVAIFIGLILSGVAKTEATQLLLAFALLSSLVLALGALFSLLLLAWTALGYQYVKNLQIRSEMIESQREKESLIRVSVSVLSALEIDKRNRRRMLRGEYPRVVIDVVYRELENNLKDEHPALYEEVMNRLENAVGV